MPSIPIRNRTGTSVTVSEDDARLLKPHKLFIDHADTIWVRNILGKQRKLTEIVPHFQIVNVLKPDREPRNT